MEPFPLVQDGYSGLLSHSLRMNSTQEILMSWHHFGVIMTFERTAASGMKCIPWLLAPTQQVLNFWMK